MKRSAVCMFAALLAIALVPTAVAHGYSADNQFLSAVAALGITGAPDQLIAAAHTVCDNIGGGPWLGMSPQMAQSLSAGVPYGMLTQFFVAAGRAYCPDKLHSMGMS